MKDLKYIVIPIIVIIISQSIKFVWEGIKKKKFDFFRLLDGMGGMPSSHSAFVTSITTLSFLDMGVSSPLFGICLCFSLVVIYDAMGVRYESGEQAKVINKIAKVNLKEKLGHKPEEVLVGVLLGMAATTGLNLLIK